MESADIADLKSTGGIRASSSLASRTNNKRTFKIE